MPLQLRYTPEAEQQYEKLSEAKTLAKQFKAVKKSLRLLSDSPKHPGLNTHKYQSLSGPGKAEVFEAYAENKTPGAWRIFWCYYPPKTSTITILSIIPHP